MKNLSVIFDIDDVLCPFTEAVLKKLSYKFDKKYDINKVQWGFIGFEDEEVEYVHELFKDSEFISSLTLYPGAKKLINDLIEIGDEIFFVSSILSNAMSARALYLIEKFPNNHPKNIMLTGVKSIQVSHVAFDDKYENVHNSLSNTPVMVTKSWNKDKKGFIRVNSNNCLKGYREIIELVRQGYSKNQIYELQNPKANIDNPIVVLVGPSGSGKTTIANNVVSENPRFKKIITYTTREKRNGEIDGQDYIFISEDLFKRKIQNGDFLEYSQYANNFYGSTIESINDIVSNNNIPVLVLDINGLNKIKETFSSVVPFYVKRGEFDIIGSIMDREIPKETKINRIIQLKDDYKTERDCLYTLDNDDVDCATQKLISIIL